MHSFSKWIVIFLATSLMQIGRGQVAIKPEPEEFNEDYSSDEDLSSPARKENLRYEVDTHNHTHTIEGCEDFDDYPEWSMDNMVCVDDLPIDELDLDGLELNETDTSGFMYVKDAKSTISALYNGEPYVFITLTYYSTEDLNVENVLDHEDGGPGIVKSEGPLWTVRTLQARDTGSRVLFDLDLSSDVAEEGFFLLDTISVSFEEPTTTIAPSTSTMITSTESTTTSDVVASGNGLKAYEIGLIVAGAVVIVGIAVGASVYYFKHYRSPSTSFKHSKLDEDADLQPESEAENHMTTEIASSTNYKIPRVKSII